MDTNIELRRSEPGGAVGTVYIVQDNPAHAFWPAEKYGKLKHCLPARGDYNVDAMVVRLREALREFNPDTDYVLLSGAPLACGTAFALLHERCDRIQVLRWSQQSQDYNLVQLDLLATSAGENAA